MTAAGRCRVTVDWYDLDITARCTLPAGHLDFHTDGVRWFTTTGLQRPACLGEPEHVARGTAAGAKRLDPERARRRAEVLHQTTGSGRQRPARPRNHPTRHPSTPNTAERH